MGAAVSAVKDAIKGMDRAEQMEAKVKQALDNMHKIK